MTSRIVYLLLIGLVLTTAVNPVLRLKKIRSNSNLAVSEQGHSDNTYVILVAVCIITAFLTCLALCSLCHDGGFASVVCLMIMGPLSIATGIASLYQ
jgi:hypothetical protein